MDGGYSSIGNKITTPNTKFQAEDSRRASAASLQSSWGTLLCGHMPSPAWRWGQFTVAEIRKLLWQMDCSISLPGQRDTGEAWGQAGGQEIWLPLSQCHVLGIRSVLNMGAPGDTLQLDHALMSLKFKQRKVKPTSVSTFGA